MRDKQAEADDTILDRIEQQQQAGREAAEIEHVEYMINLEKEIMRTEKP